MCEQPAVECGVNGWILILKSFPTLKLLWSSCGLLEQSCARKALAG